MLVSTLVAKQAGLSFFCLRANHSCENVKQAPFHMSGFVRGNLKMAYLNPKNVESLSFSVKFQVFCVYYMKSEFLKYHLSITVPMETSDDNFHVGISSPNFDHLLCLRRARISSLLLIPRCRHCTLH